MNDITVSKGKEIFLIFIENLNRYIDGEGDHLSSCLIDYITSRGDEEWNKGYYKGYCLGTKNGWENAIKKMRRTVADIEDEYNDLYD